MLFELVSFYLSHVIFSNLLKLFQLFLTNGVEIYVHIYNLHVISGNYSWEGPPNCLILLSLKHTAPSLRSVVTLISSSQTLYPALQAYERQVYAIFILCSASNIVLILLDFHWSTTDASECLKLTVLGL